VGGRDTAVGGIYHEHACLSAHENFERPKAPNSFGTKAAEVSGKEKYR
jgi:hypothetical protein